MNTNIIEFSNIISNNIVLALNKIVEIGQDGEIHNVREFRNCRNRMVAGAIGLSILHHEQSRKEAHNNSFQLPKMINSLQYILGASSGIVRYMETLTPYEEVLLNQMVSRLDLIDGHLNSANSMYELLHGIEFHGRNREVKAFEAKGNRNRLGSYYTPLKLAKLATQAAINEYLRINIGVADLMTTMESQSLSIRASVSELILSSKVVDLSCGTGNFLLAYLTEIKSIFSHDSAGPNFSSILPTILHNIRGVDVDPIVLDLMYYQLWCFSNDNGVPLVSEDIRLYGNPLLPPIPAPNVAHKDSLFDEELFWDGNYGLHSFTNNEKFDLVLGNPPWERIRPEEREFFTGLYPQLAKLTRKADRSRKISDLKITAPELSNYYLNYKSGIEHFRKIIKVNNLFPLSAVGELNTNSLFVEFAISRMSNRGVIGLLVKNALVTAAVNKRFFRYLVDAKLISHVYDFLNIKKIFAIDSRERFCYILLANNSKDDFYFHIGLEEIEQLALPPTTIRINSQLLAKLNPSSGMLPNTRQLHEFTILQRISDKCPSFVEVFPDAKFGRLVHLTNHSEFIHKMEAEDTIGVYEGKFIDQYDGKFAGYDLVPIEERYGAKIMARPLHPDCRNDRNYAPEPRFFINRNFWNKLTKNYLEEYSLMWRSLTSPTNKRTCIATILPHMPTSQSIQFLQIHSKQNLSILLSIFNSLVFDFLVRSKMSGIDLTQTIIRQIPVPPLDNLCQDVTFWGKEATIDKHILTRVRTLLNNDARLDNFFAGMTDDLIYLKDESLWQIRLQLDLLLAKAYGIDRNDFLTIILHFRAFLAEEDLKWLADHSSFLS